MVGIDPSLTGTGVTLPSGESFTIKPSGVGDARLAYLRKAIRWYLERTGWPHVRVLAAVEDLPTHSKGNVAVMGMAHGVIRSELAEMGIPRGLIVPATLKQYATGKGNADKDMMVAAARTNGMVVADHNQADSGWLQAMGEHFVGRPRFDEIGPVDLFGRAIRHHCVHGPWLGSGGAKWPDLNATPAPVRVARATSTTPLHRPAR